MKTCGRVVRLLRRRLWAMQGVFVLLTVSSAVLGVLTAVILAVDLAVILAALSMPEVSFGLVKVTLSTVVALLAFYGVFQPLHARVGSRRFALFLEGRHQQKHLDAALELGTCNQASRPGTLEEELVQRALNGLNRTPILEVVPMGRFYWLLGAFLLAGSMSLAGALVLPDAVKAGVGRLLQRQAPVRVAPSPKLDVETTVPSAPVRLAPPCASLQARVLPPAYLGAEAIPVSWGNNVHVLTGSILELTCESTSSGLPSLTAEQDTGGWTLPFRPAQGSEEGRLGVASLKVTRDSLLSIGSKGVAQPQTTALMVVEDRKPSISWLSPPEEERLRPTDSVVISFRVQDDYGLERVALEYRIPQLDGVWSRIEIERPHGRREVTVGRELPLTAMDIEGNETLEMRGVATDQRGEEGASFSETVELSVISAEAEQEETIRDLSNLRNATLGLLGRMLEEDSPLAQEPLSRLLSELEVHAVRLSDVSATVSSSTAFKGEDIRRLAGLDAAFQELPLEMLPDEKQPIAARKAVLTNLQRELEQQVLVLDGVSEKVLGEYLFQFSGRLQQELRSIQEMSQDAQKGTPRHLLVRRLRRLNRAASQMVVLKEAAQPVMPTLFSGSILRPAADEFSSISSLSTRLCETLDEDDPEATKALLDQLGLAVERTVRSVEGAYAQSMNRLSDSFRSAQTSLVGEVEQALKLNGSIRTSLETLMLDVHSETRSTIKRQRTLAIVQDIAYRVRTLQRVARKFRSATYLPVDRRAVREFRDKLSALREAVGLFQLDLADQLCQDLLTLTRSMEFSLGLTIEYAGDAKLVAQGKRELAKVTEASRSLGNIQSRLATARPQRRKLRSLQSDKLLELTQGLDSMARMVKDMKEQIAVLQKMFPLFFGRLLPMVEQTQEALVRARSLLSDLKLEDCLNLLVYVDENMSRLLSAMETASKNTKSASALAAGGSQPGMELEGKGQQSDAEMLKRYQSIASVMGEREEWKSVIDSYYSSLLQR